jgi:Ca2+-transporting ATPase
VDPSRTRSTGLTSAEAAERLATLGRNELARQRPTSPWRLLAAQLASPVVWLLLGACVVSALLGEVNAAVAIGAIVLLNALVGFFQEHRAERAVLALRSMTAPRARVLRDGHTLQLPAAEVVVGDLLVLEAGDVVAADARLREAHTLAANEAALTGESFPSEKSIQPAPAGAPLAERHDTVFLGTHIASGSGLAQVVATAMATELGKVAHLLATARSGETPLQRQLARVGRLLMLLCLGIVVVVGLVGMARGLSLFTVFISAVSLAVAAVPEGLPTIVTIALAIGVRKMATRQVLVRKLPSVETLGCATVICTDKTGTLTTGVTLVRELWGDDHGRLLEAAAANCDAELADDERSGMGDPTEVAILLAAAERGIRKGHIEENLPRVAVHPFDSDRRRMSILRADGVLYVKGAVEAILERCVGSTEGAAEANDLLAARGLRVLAVATGRGTEERELTLLGLVGIADPPRPEAIAAVAAARRAGIQTVMITGDHPITARAVATELGILTEADTADEVVHARATAGDKLDIIRSWKARGAVVAMTGDGVNDAPALREAHIGICMGRTGTEVTREAADMVLADDNFASIVAAIREGRAIYDNLRKALVYLLTGNVGELSLMLAASLAGLPLPLLPLHLLWINLVTDGLPALALVMEPADDTVMSRPPRPPTERMLGRRQWLTVLWTGGVEALVALGVFVWALGHRGEVEARTLALSTIVFAELLRSLAARSPTRLFWEVGALRNVTLLAIVAGSALLQLALHQLESTRALFQLAPLPLRDLLLVVALGAIPGTMLELSKLLGRLAARRERGFAVSRRGGEQP